MTDWNAIKTEYISQSTSYRILAEKYGLRQKTVERRGSAEGWVAQRREYEKRTREKILGAMEDREVRRAKRLQSVTDKLLDRVERELDDPRKKSSGELKSLAGTLKSIKEIQMIRSPMDDREQLAKIAALEKQAEKISEDRAVSVELAGQLKDWAK